MSEAVTPPDPREETADPTHRYAVVVAGGSGTRLWPLSRKSLPKQMQALMSDRTLIVETVDRLRGVVPDDHIFVSTTVNYGEAIRDLLPEIPRDNVIVEPEPAGTAAAFALFTYTLHERDPDAIVFSLASDHAITEVDRFQSTMRACYAFIEEHPAHVALVGIRPTRPDTGLGYIKVREKFAEDVDGVLRREVRRKADTHGRSCLPRVRRLLLERRLLLLRREHVARGLRQRRPAPRRVRAALPGRRQPGGLPGRATQGARDRADRLRPLSPGRGAGELHLERHRELADAASGDGRARG